MADERKLFDKPMDELRKAFVRARFAQGDVFGIAMIDRWLAKQRIANRPDSKAWRRILLHRPTTTWADRDFFDLRTHATSLGALNEQLGSVGMENGYGPIYDHLAFASRGIDPARGLYSGEYGLLYVEDHIHGPMFVIHERQPGVTIKRVRSRCTNPGALDIIGVVFAEWNQNRPKWESARDSLCHMLASEIDDERAKAEHDFDTAVAVSADGTKIVHADWVVVRQPWSMTRGSALDNEKTRSSYRAFPASAFHAQKCLRPDDHAFARVPRYMEAGWDVASVAREACFQHRPHLPDNAALLLEATGPRFNTRIYCTTADLCPSPLPDGGVEVTV